MPAMLDLAAENNPQATPGPGTMGARVLPPLPSHPASVMCAQLALTAQGTTLSPPALTSFHPDKELASLQTALKP